MKLFYLFFRYFLLGSVFVSIASAASADLELSEYSTPTPNPAGVGQEVTFKTQIKNKGNDTAAAKQVVKFSYNQDVTITGVNQSSNNSYFDCTPRSGTLSQGSEITCTKDSKMLRGKTRTLTIKVKPTQAGTLTQTAIASSPTNDPYTDNNTLYSSVDVNGGSSDCTGCYCNYDIGNNEINNDTSSGVLITQLNNKTSQAQKCISGISKDLDSHEDDHYHFYAGKDGNVTINAQSLNSLPSHFHLTIYRNGTEIYDENKENHTYTFAVSKGDDIEFYFEESGFSYDKYEATITFTPDTTPTNFTCANPKEFSIAAQFNIRGNIKLIGNTNICKEDNVSGQCSNPGDTANNFIKAIWRDGDTVSTTENSSAAKLVLDKNATILWAGLYWQGYFNKSNITEAEQEAATKIKIGYSKETAPSYRNINYTDITADRLNHVYFKDSRWYYQGFADVTDYVKNHGTGWYWGANIKTTLGTPIGGALGAWSIAIIYQDENETTKNLTIFDGYVAFANSSDVNSAKNYASTNGCDTTKIGLQDEATMVLSGFRTPKSGTVNSRLIFFGGEGDIQLDGDNLWITDKNNSDQLITNTTNPSNNIANSSITDEGVIRDASLLYPYFGPNTIGIDIDTFDISAIISNDQTQTNIRMNTTHDGYFPGIFGMATELYVPEVCYDYTVDLGTGRLFSEGDHNINGPVSSDRNMTTKTFVKTTQADFDLKDSIMIVRGLDATKWDFDSGEYSPSTSVAYYPADVNDSSPSHTAIGIGDDDGQMRSGGTIHPNANYYAKFHHKLKNNEPLQVNEHIELDLISHINFGSGPVEYFYTTQDGSLSRCATSPVYSPIHGRFSVERTNSKRNRIPKKYTLYTQISGREFNVDVVNYDGNSSTEQPISDIGVEVELFDAGTFENNASSGFDTVCSDYDKSRIYNTQFVTFKGSSRTRLKKLSVPVALRSAAFRVWYITDANNTLVFDDTCYAKRDNQRDSCFAGKYPEVQAQLDPKNLCSNKCSGNGNGCYECLKVNFAKSVCSRDNFAIRPESYRIVISDDREGNATNAIVIARNTKEKATKYAAGYNYRIEVNATQWGKDDNAKRYYKRFEGNDATKLVFADKSSCADTNDSIQPNYIFDDGMLIPNFLTNDNVGDYTYEITDTDWTIVDQKGSPLKPYPRLSDCIDNNTTADSSNGNIRVGCVISSKHNEKHTQMTLHFNPYSFDLSGLQIIDPGSSNKWLYMNNLKKDQTMGFTLEGNISAINKKGGITTNFTKSCAAREVKIWMARTMSPGEENITNSDGDFVPFQQALNSQVAETTQTSQDLNSTLLKKAFSDANKGTATARLIYNFKKRYTSPVTAVDVNFSTLHAASPAAKSHAEMAVDYTPEGNLTIDQNRIFYYAKVSPTPGIDGTEVSKDSIDTNFRVLAYCDTAITSDCNLSGINPGSLEGQSGTAGWYLVEDHHSTLGDGKIETFEVESTDPAGRKGDITISDSGPINFFNGVYSSVTLGCPPEKRTVTATFAITPSEWLKYNESNPDGKPRFDLIFISNGLHWKGMGDTGHIISTEPDHTNNGRLGW